MYWSGIARIKVHKKKGMTMDLKTATIIAIIGISIHFIWVVIGSFSFRYLYQISPYLQQAFWVLGYIFLHGSLILFLAVFYSKQKDST
jgi:hypothetical protein